MEQENAYPVNSREWREQYFVDTWDANGGSDQTRRLKERQGVMKRMFCANPGTQCSYSSEYLKVQPREN
jgi:hypothetical protein